MYVYINIYSYMFIKAESFLLFPFFFKKNVLWRFQKIVIVVGIVSDATQIPI